MGIIERKKREKEEKANLIINASERVFFSKGFEDATMDDIANEAEFAKGTIYLYFQSKEELYVAIISRALSCILDMFHNHVNDTISGLEKIEKLGKVLYDFNEKYPNYFEAFSVAHSIKIKDKLDKESEVIKTFLEKKNLIIEELIKIIEKGKEDGSVRIDIDAVKTAFTIITSVQSMMINLGKHELCFQMFKKHNIVDKQIINYFFYLIKEAIKK